MHKKTKEHMWYDYEGKPQWKKKPLRGLPITTQHNNSLSRMKVYNKRIYWP